MDSGDSSSAIRHRHHPWRLSTGARGLRENPLDLPAAGAGVDAAGDWRAAHLWPELRRVPQEHRDHEHPAGPGDRGPGGAALSEPATDSSIVLADFYYAGDRWRVGHWPVCVAGLVVRCRTQDVDDHGAQVGDLADCHAGG